MSPYKHLRTFISYSRVNKQFALKLVSELKAAGFSIWMDQFDIPTGKRWDDEIENALRECEIFLIIITPASIASENAKDEIGYAIDHGKRIMPVLLEECEIPLRLRRLQYVDFTHKNFDEGVKSAKELLSKLVNEESIPTPTRSFVVKDPKSALPMKSKERATQPSKINTSRTLDIRQEITVGTAKKQPPAKSIVGIIGIVVVVILVFLAGKFSAGQSTSASTPSTTSTQTQEIKPSETPASTVTAMISDTPTPAGQRFYTEEFDGSIETLMSGWTLFVKDGKENEFRREIKMGNLVVQINPQDDNPWAYLLRTGGDFKYTDVQLEVAFINDGNNANGVSLICRYSDKGWYEFTISNDGTYSIYAFGPNGTVLKGGHELLTGGSPAIKTGKVKNAFTAICKGNELTLAINGTKMKPVPAKYDFTDGYVGIGFSARQKKPVDVEFEYFKISEP